MATHSSTVAWKIPWVEEPGGPQSMGSLRVRHDWATSLSRIGEANGNPLRCSCLENPRDGGAWWAAVSGAAQSQTRLRRLSSSSSSKETEYYIISTIWHLEKASHGDYKKKNQLQTSLVVHWLRIHLPMQGTWIQFLFWEDATYHGATKPVCPNYWVHTLEPLCSVTREATTVRSRCTGTREHPAACCS